MTRCFGQCGPLCNCIGQRPGVRVRLGDVGAAGRDASEAGSYVLPPATVHNEQILPDDVRRALRVAYKQLVDLANQSKVEVQRYRSTIQSRIDTIIGNAEASIQSLRDTVNEIDFAGTTTDPSTGARRYATEKDVKLLFKVMQRSAAVWVEAANLAASTTVSEMAKRAVLTVVSDWITLQVKFGRAAINLNNAVIDFLGTTVPKIVGSLGKGLENTGEALEYLPLILAVVGLGALLYFGGGAKMLAGRAKASAGAFAGAPWSGRARRRRRRR